MQRSPAVHVCLGLAEGPRGIPRLFVEDLFSLAFPLELCMLYLKDFLHRLDLGLQLVVDLSVTLSFAKSFGFQSLLFPSAFLSSAVFLVLPLFGHGLVSSGRNQSVCVDKQSLFQPLVRFRASPARVACAAATRLPRGQAESAKASDLDIYNDNENDIDIDNYDDNHENVKKNPEKSEEQEKTFSFSLCECFYLTCGARQCAMQDSSSTLVLLDVILDAESFPDRMWAQLHPVVGPRERVCLA